MRNNQIVVLVSFLARLIDTVHQGHPHTDKTLKLLRQTCWHHALAATQHPPQNTTSSIGTKVAPTRAMTEA